jgi:hypothetical protein
VYTDADGLLAEAGSPLVAVGDVVTYHLLEAGRVPDVALVDARTERERVDPEVLARLEAGDFDRERSVENPAAVLTADLLAALRAAVGSEGTVCLDIDGEEDLATLPAVALAPDGASVVYGQPGEGMVHVVVDDEVRASARELLGRFEGDTDRLFELLGL